MTACVSVTKAMIRISVPRCGHRCGNICWRRAKEMALKNNRWGKAMSAADCRVRVRQAAVRCPSERQRSVKMFMEYEPRSLIERISPTPLLMVVVGVQDHARVANQAFAAYHQTLGPKKLVILRGGHFEAYVKELDLVSSAACDWLVAHLRPHG